MTIDNDAARARILELETLAKRLFLYLELHEQEHPQWNGNRFDDKQMYERVLLVEIGK